MNVDKRCNRSCKLVFPPALLSTLWLYYHLPLLTRDFHHPDHLHPHFIMTDSLPPEPKKPLSTVINTTTGFNKYSTEKPNAKDVQRGVAYDMFGCSLGSIPVDDFLKRFVPTSRRNPHRVPKSFFNSIPQTGLENTRYQPFVSATRYATTSGSLIIFILT